MTTNTNETPKQHTPGMACPECGFFISMSIEDVLYKQGIKCASCGLEMMMNRNMSRESLQALQQLDVAMKNLEGLKKQYNDTK